MELKLRYFLIAIVAGALLALAFILFFPGQTRTISEIKERIIRDTTTVYVSLPPRVITRWKAKIEYVRDTIIETKPFTATADTISDGDTLRAVYHFPENRFDFTETRKPDTVRVIKHYFDDSEPIVKEPPLNKWIYAGAGALGGLILGLILGK